MSGARRGGGPRSAGRTGGPRPPRRDGRVDVRGSERARVDGPRTDGRGGDRPRGDRPAFDPTRRAEPPRAEPPRAEPPRTDTPRRTSGPRSDAPRPGDPGERLVYGAGPVAELIARRPKSVRAVWVDPRRADRTTSDPVAAIVIAARLAEIKLEDRDRQTLDRVAGEGARHQGVIAWLGPFQYAHLETLVEKGDEPPLLVALDGIEDPRNLGAILRSAYLLGAGGVIIPDHRAAQVTSIVAKASAGASELLPIAQVGNLVRALDELREHGLWRVAVHATEGAQDISAIDGSLGLVIVLGAEGSGVRPLVANSCDFHAIIPMARTAVGSFNVSVAASLALYELRRQRTHRAP